MASEYNVSPETIRRALRVLADMKVIEVKPQSGALILSADSARRYIKNFQADMDIRSAWKELKTFLNEYNSLHKKISETVSTLIESHNSYSEARKPFPNYEIIIPTDSKLIGKNLNELKFWQSTGATIVAIRRGKSIILSPGPYMELFQGDLVILVGNSSAAEAAYHFITDKE